MTKLKKMFFNRQFLLVVSLALLFTFLNRYSIYFPWTTPEEEFIARSTFFKKNLNSADHAKRQDFIAKNFLLINVAHDADVYCSPAEANYICGADSSKNNSLPCYSTINRKKLAACLKWLLENKDNYNQVICDLIFADRDSSGPGDDGLQNYIASLQRERKIIFAGRYDNAVEHFERSNFARVIDDVNMGAVNEDLRDGLFFRYRLSYNDAHVKSLPLLMYERINKTDIRQNSWGQLLYKNPPGKPIRATNVFIPEMIISGKDVDSLKSLDQNDNPDSTIVRLDLWEAVRKCGTIDNFYLRRALDPDCRQKRNIFIGTFSHDHSDMHKTLYEELDGSIVLLNIYYNLVQEQNRVSTWHLLFLLVCFYLIFRRLITHPHSPYKGENRMVRFFANWFFEELHYFILIFMTIISNLWFNKVTNIIILAGFFYLFDKGMQLYKSNYTVKRTPARGKSGKKSRSS